MAEIAHTEILTDRSGDALNQPRHTLLVRVTHWINTIAFFALVVSGAAILLAHPRLYWGETGSIGSPSLIDLPLPLNLDQSGWGRSLHFLAAWVCVLNGLLYIVFGGVSGHFRTRMIPTGADLGWAATLRRLSDAFHLRKPGLEESLAYNSHQRLTYLIVVFALFPLMIVTGLAMSPAVTSLLPVIVEVFGGYQSARTVHFVVTNLLVLFLMVHVVMVCLSGFRSRMRSMITGSTHE